LRYCQDRDTTILLQREEQDAGDATMKVWIVARSHYQGSAYVHGLTEENQNIRLLQPNGTFPSARTSKFAVGQMWDLTFTPAHRSFPNREDVLVTCWKQLDPEPHLLACLSERVIPWRGGPDQLFAGQVRSIMNKKKAFISERHTLPPMSIGYWLPDAPLVKWHDDQGCLCYRYYKAEKELLIEYNNFEKPIFTLAEQTLVHVALSPWWTPSNELARDVASIVERRCYLYVVQWYV
jgi:hypothetical protein